MRRIGALVATAAAVTAAAPARAEVDSFRSSGRCTHLSAALLVDAAAADELVPDGFAVLEAAPGRAVLALVTQDCVSGIDDGEGTRAVNSVVFVFVNPAASPAGCQTYDFFWTNSRSDDWHRAMKSIGIEERLSPGTTLDIGAETAGATASAVNPYGPAPFAYSGKAIDTVTPDGPLQSVHCHVGPRGLVRSTYDHTLRAGAVALQVTLGRSALWERLGATGTATTGLFARFTWTGLTEIVEPGG